ncbi:hypothetical protein M0811_00633 [Anaeramoeba ignava]|uniref:Uncharacterized protein n=1 Tax=Anaeramoeba ignava TaxID=1746090 RepID=A0A9Q0LQW1_ANAIG|nr:hypothetical protein M0811_00633 [Anaeramoeba ignava]
MADLSDEFNDFVVSDITSSDEESKQKKKTKEKQKQQKQKQQRHKHKHKHKHKNKHKDKDKSQNESSDIDSDSDIDVLGEIQSIKTGITPKQDRKKETKSQEPDQQKEREKMRRIRSQKAVNLFEQIDPLNEPIVEKQPISVPNNTVSMKSKPPDMYTEMRNLDKYNATTQKKTKRRHRHKLKKLKSISSPSENESSDIDSDSDIDVLGEIESIKTGITPKQESF